MRLIIDRFHRLGIIASFWLPLAICGAIMFGGGALLVTPPQLPQTPMIAPAAPAATAPEPAAEIVPIFPAAVSLRVSNGDTLMGLLTDTGLPYQEASAAMEALRKIYDLKHLNPGQQVAVKLDASREDPSKPTLKSLSMPVSTTARVELRRDARGAFDARRIEAPLYKALVRVGGKITSSVYKTGLATGIPAETLAELIKVYSYDVDFQRDIQRGDRLEAIMEQLQTKEGAVASYGNVVYAALTMGKRTIAVYRYKDRSGAVDYYNEKGESLRKALLRTPINGAHITSGFGWRLHPLLGYSRMHRGVDFGASEGTPIYAAGNGTVEVAGRNGAYGNYVRLRHDAKYETAYAHASRIARGIYVGAKVKQGQVIAYVGATGLATGPHLHYEVLVGGEQVNPAGVKFKTGNSLAGKELQAFKHQVNQIKVAMGEEKKELASR